MSLTQDDMAYFRRYKSKITRLNPDYEISNLLTFIVTDILTKNKIVNVNIIRKVYVASFLILVTKDKYEADYRQERKIIKSQGDGGDFESDIIEMLSYTTLIFDTVTTDAEVVTKETSWKLIPKIAWMRYHVSPGKIYLLYTDNCVATIDNDFSPKWMLFDDDTPKSPTDEDVMMYVSFERIKEFYGKGCVSQSLIDYFYNFTLYVCEAGLKMSDIADVSPFLLMKTLITGIIVTASSGSINELCSVLLPLIATFKDSYDSIELLMQNAQF